MDSGQVGKFIRDLRVEINMTQRKLAEQLNITEQAVSKWERGLGSPDVALLSDLSEILGVNVEKIFV